MRGEEEEERQGGRTTRGLSRDLVALAHPYNDNKMKSKDPVPLLGLLNHYELCTARSCQYVARLQYDIGIC